MLNLHTYVIGHYNLSVRIIDLVSHTNYIVCVNFIHECRGLQFKIHFQRQIFEKASQADFNLLSRVSVRNLLKDSCRRNNFLYFVLGKNI